MIFVKLKHLYYLNFILDEDVRQRQTEKQWREHTRNAWVISPALAVFLPQRINNKESMAKEVTRLVR